MVLGEQDVCEGGGSLRGFGIGAFGEGEVAAVGALGCGKVGGGFGDLGGEEDVFGEFGGELDGA